MDHFINIYSNVWTFVESLAFLFVVLIFFIDPIRRWNFFGYRPTAVMGLYDPIMEKVLFCKVNGAWSFSQGGMYQNNIYLTVNNVIKRELGIPETRFKLVFTRPLGTMRITNPTLIRRARISTISIFSTMRGKGYLGCFVRINLKDIESAIKRGTGVEECRVVSVDEAKKLLDVFDTDEHKPVKKKMILTMLDEIEQYSKGVKDWETQQTNLAEVKEKVEDEEKKLQGEKKEKEILGEKEEGEKGEETEEKKDDGEESSQEEKKESE